LFAFEILTTALQFLFGFGDQGGYFVGR